MPAPGLFGSRQFGIEQHGIERFQFDDRGFCPFLQMKAGGIQRFDRAGKQIAPSTQQQVAIACFAEVFGPFGIIGRPAKPPRQRGKRKRDRPALAGPGKLRIHPQNRAVRILRSPRQTIAVDPQNHGAGGWLLQCEIGSSHGIPRGRRKGRAILGSQFTTGGNGDRQDGFWAVGDGPNNPIGPGKRRSDGHQCQGDRDFASGNQLCNPSRNIDE